MVGQWVKSLDGLLRGDTTRLAALRRGEIDIPASGLSVLIIVLGAFYGACMASFAAFNRPAGMALLQMIASAGKVPLLFFLTLFVTFPSLYVFNALIGSRLTLRATWQLLIATLAVMMAVLASLGPVVAFFSVSTTGYSFMLLFNVVICAASGFLGLKFLLFTLHRLTIALEQSNAPQQSTPLESLPPEPATSAAPAKIQTVNPNDQAESKASGGMSAQSSEAAKSTHESTPAKSPIVSPDQIAPSVPLSALPVPPQITSSQAMPPQSHLLPCKENHGALEKMDDRAFSGNVTAIFRIWIVVFALVGAQMSWVLRPFIGAPNVAFAWLRERDSNFFEAVLHAFGSLLGFK